MKSAEYRKSYVTDAPHNFIVVAALTRGMAWAMIAESGYKEVSCKAQLVNKEAVRLVQPETAGFYEMMSDHPWDLWVYNHDGNYLLVRPRA